MAMKQIAALACAVIAMNAIADNIPPSGADSYFIAMTVTTGGDKSAPRLMVKEGELFKIAMENKGVKFVASFVLTADAKNTVKLDGTVECGKATPSHAVLITALGETATVKVAETGAPGCELAMVVSEVPKTPAAR
jgi:hypothetical protein